MTATTSTSGATTELNDSEAEAPDAAEAGTPEPTDAPRDAAPTLKKKIQIPFLAQLKALVFASLGLVLFGIAWHFASTSSELPGPKAGLEALKVLLSDPLYDKGPNDKGVALRLYISLKNVFTGFGLAALVGIPLGLLIGSSKAAWQAFNPIVQVLRPVSPLAWYPIWLTILAQVSPSIIVVIFITALWPTVLNTAAGVADIPRDQKNVALVFQFSRLTYVRHVLIPNALSSIVSGLRLSMGIAWLVLVAVEMLSATPGIGGFVWESYNTSNLANAEAAIIIIGVVGLALDMVLLRLARLATVREVQS